MIGPGKYDDLATYVREKSGGMAVAVIVINGERGAGFSVQGCSRETALILADVLEHMVSTIRKDCGEAL